MSLKKAREIVKEAKQNNQERIQEAANHLKTKATQHINDMVRRGEFVSEMMLEERLLPAVTSVVQDLRDLGYYSCLVEVESEKGDTLFHRLRLSFEHLKD